MSSFDPTRATGSNDHLLHYTQQLANIHKKQKSVKYIQSEYNIYINHRSKTIQSFPTMSEAKAAGFKEIGEKKLYKIIKNERNDNSSKITRSALKSIFFSTGLKKIKLEAVINDFPEIQKSISKKKESTITTMLANVEGIHRSSEGGNGVIFINCEISLTIDDPDLRNGNFIVKFEKKGKEVTVADNFVRMMGFEAPHSNFVALDSNLGKSIVAVIDHNLAEDIDINHHEQIRQQRALLPQLIIMNQLTAISLRQLPVPQLETLLQNSDFQHQLGKMIIIDTFMNNSDRLNTMTCNLGNIMVTTEGSLALIDQEIKIHPTNVDEIANRLKEILSLEKTKFILYTLAGALRHDRKDNTYEYGKISLDERMIEQMVPQVEAGMKQAALEVVNVINSRGNLNKIIQPFTPHSERIHTGAIVQLSEKLNELNKKMLS